MHKEIQNEIGIGIVSHPLCSSPLLGFLLYSRLVLWKLSTAQLFSISSLGFLPSPFFLSAYLPPSFSLSALGETFLPCRVVPSFIFSPRCKSHVSGSPSFFPPSFAFPFLSLEENLLSPVSCFFLILSWSGEDFLLLLLLYFILVFSSSYLSAILRSSICFLRCITVEALHCSRTYYTLC